MKHLKIELPVNFNQVLHPFFQLVYKTAMKELKVSKTADLEGKSYEEIEKLRSLKGDPSTLISHFRNILGIKFLDEKEVFEFERTFDDFDLDSITKVFTNRRAVIMQERVLNGKSLAEVSTLFPKAVSKETVRIHEVAIFKILSAYVSGEPFNSLLDKVEEGSVFTDILFSEIKDKRWHSILIKIILNKNKNLHYNKELGLITKVPVINLNDFLYDLFEDKELTPVNKTLFYKEVKERFDFDDVNAVMFVDKLFDMKKVKSFKDSLYLYPKTKRSALSLYLLNIGRPVNLKEELDSINKELPELFPNLFSKEDVIKFSNLSSLLYFLDDVILYDWGTYSHISNLKNVVNNFNVEEVLSHIDKKMEEVEVYSLYNYFIENKDLFSAYGVNSVHLLYEILRIKDKKYKYWNSFWVYKEGVDPKKKISEFIADYVQQQGGEVSFDEIIDRFGVSRQKIFMLLKGNNNIKISDDGQLIVLN